MVYLDDLRSHFCKLHLFHNFAAGCPIIYFFIRLSLLIYCHKCKFYGLLVINLRFNIQYYTSSVFARYLAQNQLLFTFYLLDLAQDCPRRLHIAPLYGDNPYFTAFIALKPSEQVYFIEAIYRACYDDLRCWFINSHLCSRFLFILVNLLFLIL